MPARRASTLETEEADELSLEYRKLKAIADAGDEEEYRQCLARIRDLEDAEIRQMEEYFEEHSPLSTDVVRHTMEQVDELLAKYEDTPSPDTAADDPDQSPSPA